MTENNAAQNAVVIPKAGEAPPALANAMETGKLKSPTFKPASKFSLISNPFVMGESVSDWVSVF
jgi:hypothetical protein